MIFITIYKDNNDNVNYNDFKKQNIESYYHVDVGYFIIWITKQSSYFQDVKWKEKNL